jgi:hypothetical protein
VAAWRKLKGGGSGAESESVAYRKSESQQWRRYRASATSQHGAGSQRSQRGANGMAVALAAGWRVEMWRKSMAK